MRDAMELLVEQITVFSPIHDLIGTNLAHRQDALDYLQGRIDSPFPPPEFLLDVFRHITQPELENLYRAANTTEAYAYIKWLHQKRWSPKEAGPEPEMTRSPKPMRKSRGGYKLSQTEVEERYRLAPTMTSYEFAQHFGLKKPGSACKWCMEHGLKLKDMRRKAR